MVANPSATTSQNRINFQQVDDNGFADIELPNNTEHIAFNQTKELEPMTTTEEI